VLEGLGSETLFHFVSDLREFFVDGFGAFEVPLQNGLVVSVDFSDEPNELGLKLGLAAYGIVLPALHLGHEPAENVGLGFDGNEVEDFRGRE
jgi:hypothetical protein